jgi:hypothetical protein
VPRDAGSIAPAALLPITPRDQIFEEFGDHPRRERGLAPKSIVRQQPIPAWGVPCRGRRPRQDQPGGRHPPHRAPRSGSERGIWEGPNPLAALDQAMEAREPAERDGRAAASGRRRDHRKDQSRPVRDGARGNTKAVPVGFESAGFPKG